ncbi:MAG: hypothetical protein JWQ32_902 [Marmoricola sp.]|nr:hypothetical protein [Marmoricola sp.]
MGRSSRSAEKSRLSLAGAAAAASIVAAVAVILPASAFAVADSVAISSPADGSTVELAAQSSSPSVAADPLVVQFTATGATPMCSLDGATPTGCVSPVSYAHVSAGSHTITVQAGAASQTNHFVVDTVVLDPPPVVRPPYVSGQLHDQFLVRGRRTYVRQLLLTDLQRRVHVTLVCRGRGCPSFKPYSRTVSGTAHLGVALRGAALRPRTTLTIRASKAGHRTKVWLVTVRRGTSPSLRVHWA